MKHKNQHIMFICTEDWFFRSHFLPLNQAALSIEGCQTSVLCNLGPAQTDLSQAGLKLHQADFSRRSFNPFLAIRLLRQLFRTIRQEKPDTLHFISLKPVLFGGFIALFFPKTAKIYHVTGMGTLSEGTSLSLSAMRQVIFRLVTFYLRRPKSWLLTENPDDLAVMEHYGTVPETRITQLGGAGVDPDFYTMQSPLPHDRVHIAYVGRMIWIKGVDLLVEAQQLLHQKGIEIQLDLYGDPDIGNPKQLSTETLEAWNDLPGISWHGRTDDILSVWHRADIAVIPTRTGEGMPRTMLEAASCGLPLIVTDVPGPRHFVTDGTEGLVIPPRDVTAMAAALEKLVKDKPLRLKMGEAARKQVLAHYTEKAVRQDMVKVYRTLQGETSDMS